MCELSHREELVQHRIWEEKLHPYPWSSASSAECHVWRCSWKTWDCKPWHWSSITDLGIAVLRDDSWGLRSSLAASPESAWGRCSWEPWCCKPWHWRCVILQPTLLGIPSGSDGTYWIHTNRGRVWSGSCPNYIKRLGYILNCLLMVTFQYSPFIFLVINNDNGSLFIIRILCK